MLRLAVRVVGWGLLAVALVCVWAFYEQYWRWRDCFNELGRCWSDELQVVFTDDAGLAWGTLTVLFAALAALVLWIARGRPDKQRVS